MRKIKITESIPVDMEWEDNIGVGEVSVEVHTGSFNIFAEVRVEIQDDSRLYNQTRAKSHELIPYIEIEDLYVEDTFGREVELTDEEYLRLYNNIKKNLKW